MHSRLLRAWLPAALLFQSALCLAAELKIEPVADQPFFPIDDARTSDLSGLSYSGAGDEYFAVSDKTKTLLVLKIQVDASSGRVTSGTVARILPVNTTLSDFEGVAYLPEKRRVFISAETGNGVISLNPAGGDVRAQEVPAVFNKARVNKSLESLTFGAGAFWIANEEALEGDGPISGPSNGTRVRLQKLDAAFHPLAQFAYDTNPSPRRVHNAGTGVSDLLALPGGDLLVLERVVGIFGLTVKIYRVDFSGATDTSRMGSLENAPVTPVKKTLLFEAPTLTSNFEGITLGPELADGWRSLLLIADSSGQPRHMLMALRLKGL